MAWIKLEHDTPDKPEVIGIAHLLGIDQDAVVGKLTRLWIWADKQTLSRNGRCNADGNGECNADSVTRTMSLATKAFIDRYTSCQGFADAMESVGWVVVQKDGSLGFPNFDRHNGQTAKDKGLTNRRVAKHRAAKESEPLQIPLQEPLPTPLQEALHKPLPKQLPDRDRDRDFCSDSDLKGAALSKTYDGGAHAKDLGNSIRELAGRLWDQSGYDRDGNDGAVFWQAAWMAKLGPLSEAVAHSAANACKIAGAEVRDAPAFFRTTIENKAWELLKVDFKEELKSLPPMPRTHPANTSQSKLEKFYGQASQAVSAAC